jgi:hypothetical protein
LAQVEPGPVTVTDPPEPLPLPPTLPLPTLPFTLLTLAPSAMVREPLPSLPTTISAELFQVEPTPVTSAVPCEP